MELELFFAAAWTTMFILVINKIEFFKPQGVPIWLIVSTFIAKVVSGVLLYVVYTKYYPDRSTADIFRYFDDSRIMYDALASQPLDFLKMLTGIGNNNAHFNQYYFQMNNWCSIYPTNIYGDGHIMIRFNALLRLFSFGIYHVHTVFLCMLSFTGLMGLYKFFMFYLKDHPIPVFLGVFWLPSVMFWGSGVLKEGLVLFALGTGLYQLYRLTHEKFNLVSFIILIFCILLLRYLKFYYFIFSIPLMAGYVWVEKTGQKKVLLKYLISFSVVIMAGIFMQLINPNYNIFEILARKQNDLLQVALDSGAGSLISTQPVRPTVTSIIPGLAKGFVSCFTRPGVWELQKLIMWPAALENLVLFLGLIYAAFGLLKRPKAPVIFWFSVLFVLAVMSLTGLLCTASGALVRYKVPALPFLFLVIFSLRDWKMPKKLLKS